MDVQGIVYAVPPTPTTGPMDIDREKKRRRPIPPRVRVTAATSTSNTAAAVMDMADIESPPEKIIKLELSDDDDEVVVVENVKTLTTPNPRRPDPREIIELLSSDDDDDDDKKEDEKEDETDDANNKSVDQSNNNSEENIPLADDTLLDVADVGEVDGEVTPEEVPDAIRFPTPLVSPLNEISNQAREVVSENTESTLMEELGNKNHDDYATKPEAKAWSSLIVGDRISVLEENYWDDDQWNDGEIVAIDGNNFLVRWDDFGDQDWTRLDDDKGDRPRWKFSSKTKEEKRREDASKRRLVDSLTVGMTLNVWWPTENQFFLGVLRNIEDGDVNPHFIEYEDGDEEHTNLFFRTFNVEDTKLHRLKPGSKIFVWNTERHQYVNSKIVEIDKTKTNPHLIAFGKGWSSQEWLDLKQLDFVFPKEREAKEKNDKSVGGHDWKSTSKHVGSRTKMVEKLDLESGEVLAEFSSIRSAAQSCGDAPNPSHISRVCRGNRKSAGGYFWRYKGSSSEPSPPDNVRRVEQLCPKTSKVLACHKTIADAARTIGVGQTSISTCCEGSKSMAGGFKWRYARSVVGKEKKSSGNEARFERSTKAVNNMLADAEIPQSGEVQQVNPKTKKVLKTFTNISEATKATGVNSGSIYRCCYGIQMTSGGFGWRFSDWCASAQKHSSGKEIQWRIKGIIGHEGPFTKKDPKWNGCAYNLIIDWVGSYDPTSEPLDHFYQQQPKLVRNYATEHGLLQNSVWKRIVGRSSAK